MGPAMDLPRPHLHRVNLKALLRSAGAVLSWSDNCLPVHGGASARRPSRWSGSPNRVSLAPRQWNSQPGKG